METKSGGADTRPYAIMYAQWLHISDRDTAIQEYRRREKEKKIKYMHGVGVDEHLEVGI